MSLFLNFPCNNAPLHSTQILFFNTFNMKISIATVQQCPSSLLHAHDSSEERETRNVLHVIQMKFSPSTRRHSFINSRFFRTLHVLCQRWLIVLLNCTNSFNCHVIISFRIGHKFYGTFLDSFDPFSSSKAKIVNNNEIHFLLQSFRS